MGALLYLMSTNEHIKSCGDKHYRGKDFSLLLSPPQYCRCFLPHSFNRCCFFFYIFILYSSFFCLFLDVQCRQCRQCMYIFGNIVKEKKNIILRLFIFAWIFFIHHFSNVWFSLSASVNIVFFFFFSLMSFFCTCHSSFGNLLLRFFSVHTYLYANTIAFLRWISKKKNVNHQLNESKSYTK